MAVFTDDNETKVTLESAGARALPDEMPFRLLLLGDWSGGDERAADSTLHGRRAIEIDRDNFEDVMRRMRVRLSLELQGGGILELRFQELDDFHPDRLFHQVSLFADLRDARRGLSNSQTFNETARQVRSWFDNGNDNSIGGGETASNENALSSAVENFASAAPDNILDQILSESGQAPEKRSAAPVTASRELNALLGELVRPHLVQTDEAEQSKLLEAVDRATGELMRAILHHPRFQALEAAWRGVYLVTSRVDTASDLKIYLLDASKAELQNDLKSVGNLAESGFYKLLMEETPGNYGDESWAAVCANYVFEPNVDDAAALMRIAQIAAAADTPFIAEAAAKIVGAESIAAAPDSEDWSIAEDSTEAKLWAMLRGLPEASYIGLALPRFMARVPYGAKSEPTDNFAFEEVDLSAPVHEDYLWANPAFVCAVLLAQGFRESGWEMKPGAARDIDDLPIHLYREGGETKIKPGAEVVMTLQAAEKILEQGLMPLISYRDSDRVRLASFQSIASPPQSINGKWAS